MSNAIVQAVWNGYRVRTVTGRNKNTYYAMVDVLDYLCNSKRLVARLLNELQDNVHVAVKYVDDTCFIANSHMIIQLRQWADRRRLAADRVEDFVQSLPGVTEDREHAQIIADLFEGIDDEDQHQEEAYLQDSSDEPQDENQRPAPMTLSNEELKLRCTILDSMCNAIRSVDAKEDPELHKQCLVQINNLQRVIAACTPMPPVFRNDNTPMVRISKRLRALRPNLANRITSKERYVIGKKASIKHEEYYGVLPPKCLAWSKGGVMRPINRYTEHTAVHTLDAVIEEEYPEDD